MNIFGTQIVASSHAVTTRVWYAVERVNKKLKRRNNWKVVRHEQIEPAAYQLENGTLVMHPSLIAKLPKVPNGQE